MSANEYHFVSYWHVEGTAEQVFDVLTNAEDLTRWWPSVYLSVKQPEPGGPIELLTKGWLPYTLHWFFRVTESNRPGGFSLEAWGDFDGRGVWNFEQDGAFVNITYDWRIRAEKPLLRYLSFLLKPLFSANHRWAMARGEESLRSELARRAGAGQQSAGHTS
ncbi:MAG TPA: SRPBCC family protein [Bryobacteraceae bacterium]|nr:SRPBCC family protein [Bryobacteraceae bacterium]